MTSAMHRRPVQAALLAAVGCALPAAAPAQVVGRFSGSATLGDGYSANPFLVEGDDTGSGYIELTLAPTYELLESTGSTVLAANYRRSEYYRRYSSSESYGAFISHNRRLDPRTSLNVDIGYDSSIQGERQPFFAPPFGELPQAPDEPSEPDPGQPDIPDTAPDAGIPLDPTLIGNRLRRDFLNVAATLSSRPSPFDSYSLSVRASRSFSASPQSADYRSYGETFSYSRRLSERVDVGVRATVDRTDYINDSFPDAVVVQPQLTYGQRLSPFLTLDAALGASFVDSEGPEDSQSLSGSLSLCWLDPRSTLCLSADRSASGSGASGVANNLSGSLSYSYRLSARDTVSAAIAYQQTSRLADQTSELLGIERDSEYLNTSISWSTQATSRLSGGASLSFRRIFESLRSASADVNGQVYLRLSFGQ